MNATDDRANDRRRLSDDSDGTLLGRYLVERDQSAFAELVARHGRMVFGVCLRRLVRTQDAEDAFQAVFLGLARQSEKLKSETCVGGWLHSVARRVCASALRSRKRSWVSWSSVPEPASSPAAEVDVDLDAALATLNDQERNAVVLCHLEGLSRAEAAARLAIPEGTLSARLSRALEKLRRKLRRQPVAALAAAAVVVLPNELTAATVGLVRPVPEGSLQSFASPRVLELCRTAVPIRLIDRVRTPLAVMAALLVVILGIYAGWRLLPENKQEAVAQQSVEQPSHPPKSDSIVTTVEQKGRPRTDVIQPATSPAVLDIVRLTINGTKSQNIVVWTMFAKESLAGAQVQHWIQEWRGMGPILRQLATPGRSIEITIEPGDVSRLEANQIVNICRRGGFRTIKYDGPSLFTGDASRDAFAEKLVSRTDLADVREDLPDWTNGWVVRGSKLEQRTDSEPASRKMLVELAAIVGGAKGPAYSLLPEQIPKVNEALVARPMDEFKSIGAGSVHLSAPERDVTNLLLFQSAVATSVRDPKAFGPLLERAARASNGEFEVLVGVKDLSGAPSNVVGPVNPLNVNLALNSLSRGGVKTIDYCGPTLFTGDSIEAAFDVEVLPVKTIPQKQVLRAPLLNGELPDPTNGWKATLRVDQRSKGDGKKSGSANQEVVVYRIERTR